MNCPNCHCDIQKSDAKCCPVCGAELSSLLRGEKKENTTLDACPSTYQYEANARHRLYPEKKTSLPAKPDNGGEIANPPMHTYGAKLFQDKKDCCVVITTPTGAGTGFFLKNGLIATNAHVIGDNGEPSASITVEHRGVAYNGRVLRADFDEDVALVDLPAGGPVGVEQYVNELGNSRDLLPGDQVFSVGNSRGWGLTYNQFVIKDRTKKQGFLDYCEVILMNGTCQPGNSGGPVYNVAGQVVGILSFSPVTLQRAKIYLPDKSALKTYIACAEPGVCGAVTVETLLSLMKGEN